MGQPMRERTPNFCMTCLMRRVGNTSNMAERKLGSFLGFAIRRPLIVLQMNILKEGEK